MALINVSASCPCCRAVRSTDMSTDCTCAPTSVRLPPLGFSLEGIMRGSMHRETEGSERKAVVVALCCSHGPKTERQSSHMKSPHAPLRRSGAQGGRLVAVFNAAHAQLSARSKTMPQALCPPLRQPVSSAVTTGWWGMWPGRSADASARTARLRGARLAHSRLARPRSRKASLFATASPRSSFPHHRRLFGRAPRGLPSAGGRGKPPR
jgi:hypothetical protein